MKSTVLTVATTAAVACALDLCQAIDAVRLFVAGMVRAVLYIYA
jgi:hypothetical protein